MGGFFKSKEFNYNDNDYNFGKMLTGNLLRGVFWAMRGYLMEWRKNLSWIRIIKIFLVVILVSFLVGQYLYLLDIFNIEWMVYWSEPNYKLELKLKDIKETEAESVYRIRDQVSVRNYATKSEIRMGDGQDIVISKEPEPLKELVSKELVSKKPEPNDSNNSGCCYCVFNWYNSK